jgi:hypothetical protein
MKLQEGRNIIFHPDLTPRIIAQVVGEDTWLCLKYYYGIGTSALPSQEISEKLGIVQNTVVRRAGRGLLILHDYLESLSKLREYING